MGRKWLDAIAASQHRSRSANAKPDAQTDRTVLAMPTRDDKSVLQEP